MTLASRIAALTDACKYAAEGYEVLLTETMPRQRAYFSKPESIAKHDEKAAYVADQVRILRDAGDLLTALESRLAGAEAETIERCAKICEEVAERDRKFWAERTDEWNQPYASNRIWHTGQNCAAAIRAGKETGK